MPCSDDNWGESAVYDFSSMTRSVQIKQLKGNNDRDFWDINEMADANVVEY